MKKILFLLVLFILMPRNVYADATKLLDEYADLYGEVFEKGISGAENSFMEIMPDFNPKQLLRDINSGNISISLKDILKYLLKLLLDEIYAGIKLMAIVLTMSVLSSYLSELKSSFGGESVATVAFYTCYIIIAGVAATAFYEAASCVSETVSSIAFFMRVLVPVMVTTLMTSGAIISATVFEPTLIAIVEIGVWVIDGLFLPLVMISTALNIVNGMSQKFKTDKMVLLINNGVKWGLSVMLTIFVSITGLKSIASSGADALTIKLSKFAASNLIPMVGGILAESVETVMGCSVVIKNSVGILGIICLIVIVLMPIIKISSILILFRITAAIIEPISDIKISDCMTRLAGSVSSLFSMLTATTVMFIIIITIMINAGSSAVMAGG